MSVDHQRRVARLLRGEQVITDLDRLFADLRTVASCPTTVREVGDFAAHRAERDKGIVMARAADMQIAARSWLRQLQGQIPTLEESAIIAEANLRTASDERIMNAIGMTRTQARSHYQQAARRLGNGRMPKPRQKEAFNWLATSFIWETAFDEDQLMQDFTEILITTGALEEKSRKEFGECKTFVTLHALTVMHMSNLLMPDRHPAPLRLMTREKTGTLRIKANIPLAHVGKPVSCIVSVFETTLDAAKYSKVQTNVSDFEAGVPIEINSEGLIVEIGEGNA